MRRSIALISTAPIWIWLSCSSGTSGAPPPAAGSCTGCQRTKTGSPAWEIGDAALFSANVRRTDVVSSLLGPRHQYYSYEGVIGPAVPHAGPYDSELAAMLAARALTPTQSFTAADLDAPFGAVMAMVIVPGAGAPSGSSFDFGDGPIIPNARFPITARGRLSRDGVSYAQSLLLTMIGYDRFMSPIPGDGESHFFFTFIDGAGSGLLLPADVPDGAYTYEIAVVDAGGDGWTIDVPFTVGVTSLDGGTSDGSMAAPLCAGAPPRGPLITDLSEAVAATANGTGVSFGTPSNIAGQAYSYASRDLAVPVVSLVSAAAADGGSPTKALRVVMDTGTTTDPTNNGGFGFGLAFDSCIDASAYAGVQFTIAGDLPTCGLRFAVSFSEDEPPSGQPPNGSCTAATCTPPSTQVLAGGTVVVPFDGLTSGGGGSPTSDIDRTRVTGLRWLTNVLLDGSSCTGDFTIDDVMFILQAPPPPPTCANQLGTPSIAGPGAPPGRELFTFAGPGLAPPAVYQVISSAQSTLAALEVTADLGAADGGSAGEVGFGMYLCSDVSAYTALKLTVAGDLGGCALSVSVNPTEDLPPHFAIGTCTAPVCRPPRSPPLALGTNVVRFSEMTGGVPLASVDPITVGAVEWTFTAPADGGAAPCQANLRITDVAFTND